MTQYEYRNHAGSPIDILKDYVLSTVSVWQHVRNFTTAEAMAVYENQASQPTGHHDVIEVGWRGVSYTDKQSVRDYLAENSDTIYQQILTRCKNQA